MRAFKPRPLPYVPTSKSSNPTPWSEYQLAVFRRYVFGTGNIDTQSVAGSGKTALQLGIMELAAKINPRINILYAAYSKRIVTEIEEKLNSGRFLVPSHNVTVGTFHSILLRAIRDVPTHRWIQNSEWEKHRAVIAHLDAEFKEIPGDQKRRREDSFIPYQWQGPVKDLASAARFSGYLTVPNGGSTPLEFTPEEWKEMADRYDVSTFMPDKTPEAYVQLVDWTKAYLSTGLEINTRVRNPAPVDFDDMIWLPLVHDPMGKKIRQYDLVLVDEAQDLNYVRRLALGRLIKPGGRIVATGDPRQAIFAFTGAAYDSLDRIKADYNTHTLPLHVSYRCPKAVVKVAQQWVDHIQPAETAEEGEVFGPVTTTFEALHQQHDWFRHDPAGTAILCRNNQPLVRVFFELLRLRIPAVILGNDIAKQMEKVIKLALTLDRRVHTAYQAQRYTVRQLAALIDKWESGEVKAYKEAGKLWKVAKVEDICGGVRILLRQMPLTATVQDVQARLKEMFTTEEGEKADRVVLSSIHKSKGLEWNTVIWYGQDKYQPSKYAKTKEDITQEDNLCYVAATRAQKRLVRVNAAEDEARERVKKSEGWED